MNRIAEEYEGEEPTAAENVEAFAELPYEEQKKAGISEGHSGNSFGFAVRLACLSLTIPAWSSNSTERSPRWWVARTTAVLGEA